MAVHPIFALILCGNIVEVVTLIKSDPNVIKEKKGDFDNVWPLHYAVYHGQYFIVKKLMKYFFELKHEFSILNGSKSLFFGLFSIN